MEMKMTTGVSGPTLTLSKNDEHEFSDSEAISLFNANFAEPTDKEAFAKLLASVAKEPGARSIEGKSKGEGGEANLDADLDNAKTHALIDAIAKAENFKFPDDITKVTDKVTAVRTARIEARSKAENNGQQD